LDLDHFAWFFKCQGRWKQQISNFQYNFRIFIHGQCETRFSDWITSENKQLV